MPGKSYIYNLEGDINETDETIDGKHFFRKIKPYKYEGDDEVKITKLIDKNRDNIYQYKNIVEFYKIDSNYIDMELLNTNYELSKDIIEKMCQVKTCLQSIGIFYIDWKPDNIGIASNGEPKLYDFDCSGIYKGDKWLIEPGGYLGSYAYKKFSYLKDPKKIDDACFDSYLAELIVKT